MRALLGLILLLSSTICIAQTPQSRDDRDKKATSTPINPKRPLTEKEKEEQEKLQKEKAKAAGSNAVQDTSKTKRARVSDTRPTPILPNAAQMKADSAKAAGAKAKPGAPTTTPATTKKADSAATKGIGAPIPIDSAKTKTDIKAKTDPKAKKAAKEKPVKPLSPKELAAQEAEAKKNAPKPKVQKKPKGKKYKDETLKEYALYAERPNSDPELADVAIMLPKSKPKDAQAENFAKGVELVQANFPDKAIKVLKECYTRDPKNANVNYWLGMAYLNSFSGRERAIPYLKVATDHTDYQYNKKSPTNEVLAPLDAMYHLGYAHMLEGDWDKADRHFRLFTTVAKPNDPMIKKAELGMKQVAVASKMIKNPKKNVSVKNAGDGVNTPYADFGAYLTLDGTELFFTSARQAADAASSMNQPIDAANGKYFDDIYSASLNKEGVWEDAKAINIDSAQNDDYVRGITPNSKTIFLHINTDESTDLYESSFAFGTWQPPVMLFPQTNTLKWGRNFYMAPDKSIMYFASSELGGFGGSDIFFVSRRLDGSWTEPQNAGKNINSAYDEDYPYLHPNKRTLFYSSNGESSMGGYDIFRSTLVGEWQTGENVGYPINTVEDDLYFSLAPDGRTGYYSRKGKDGKGDLDIYQINYYSLNSAIPPRLQASFKIDLQKAPDPKKAKKNAKKAEQQQEVPEENNEIILTNVLTQEKFIYKPNIRTGNFSVYLDPCTRYSIEYKKNGQTVRNEDFVAPCEMQAADKIVDYDPVGTLTPKATKRALPSINKTEANLQGYAWQLTFKGAPCTQLGYTDINYLKTSGDILGSMKMDSEGIFAFMDIPDDQDYIFELKLPQGMDCKDYKVILTKDRKAINNGVVYQVVCY